jgi:hypothetical protein
MAVMSLGRLVALPGLLLGIVASPVQAQLPEPKEALAAGFAGALRACEQWILEPESWADGYGPFLQSVGLGPAMFAVATIEEFSQPPKSWRVANHYWRINATQTAGYLVVVSDQLPICHITGGGQADLQPIVEAVLSSTAFKARWHQVLDNSLEDMVSTGYENSTDSKLHILVSRAKKAGDRQDRVQVIVSGAFEPDS